VVEDVQDVQETKEALKDTLIIKGTLNSMIYITPTHGSIRWAQEIQHTPYRYMPSEIFTYLNLAYLLSAKSQRLRPTVHAGS
jgi:hypothetical protein